jgi:hypothetical protein
MQRRVNRLVYAFLAMVILLGVTASVNITAVGKAQAAYNDCPDAKLCTFWDWDYKGSHYDYTSPFYTCIEIGAPWDNETSSIVNKRSIPVRFYTNHGCLPATWDVSVRGNSGAIELALCCSNDRMSSFMISWDPPGGLHF